MFGSKVKFKQIFCCFLVLLTLSSGYSPVSALASPAPSSQNLSIQLSPLPISLTGAPGSTVSTQLRVRNTGDQNETLKISLKSVSQTGFNGQISVTNFSSSNPLPGWIHFSSPVFSAPAGEWQSITMSVNIPKSAAYGYYFAVQFQLANSPKSEPGHATIEGAADLFVLLNAVAPGEISKTSLTTFSTTHSLYSYLPVSFLVRLHNDGNIDAAPHGNIFIMQGSKTIGTINVNSSLGSILPKSYRVFTASWSDGFPVYTNSLDINGQTISNGHGGVKQHLVWNFSKVPKLRFGHYTARLLMVYNDGTRDVPIEASVGFWVIPWLMLILIFLVVVFTAVGLWASIRSLSRVNRKKKVINLR